MTPYSIVRVEAERSYDVTIGAGAMASIPDAVGAGCRVGLVRPSSLADVAGQAARSLRDGGIRCDEIVVPDAEAAKTADVAAKCWAELGRRGFTRSDTIIGLGGGSTTDLAGFVAATFLRGMRVVLVPTTLLGMVDAAVGGKTGINTAEGKNLVGAFHEPAAVICDLDFLRSLPAPDLASGLAEVVKCGLIADRAIVDLVAADPRQAADPGSPRLAELIVRAVEVKAGVVRTDLRESVSMAAIGREALNYGHTLGHAIERIEGYRFRHGDAVSIGLVYAAELARLVGLLDDAAVLLHRELLSAVGLPTAYPGDRWAELRAAIRLDKKARGDRLRFVVLAGIGHPRMLESPGEDVLEASYARISG